MIMDPKFGFSDIPMMFRYLTARGNKRQLQWQGAKAKAKGQNDYDDMMSEIIESPLSPNRSISKRANQRCVISFLISFGIFGIFCDIWDDEGTRVARKGSFAAAG